MDGQPLPARDGPFRLVVEGDLRPARMVTAIKAVTLGEGKPVSHDGH